MTGLYVLRTNTKLTPLQVMRRYRKDLLRVEQLFRQAKAVCSVGRALIYHSSDMAIRGHVFCSFLACQRRRENAPAGRSKIALHRRDGRGCAALGYSERSFPV